jgi:hypothetical protein
MADLYRSISEQKPAFTAFEVEPGDHGYFEALITRPDIWKAYSLRPVVGAAISSPYYEHQLKRPNLGGYAASNNTVTGTWVNYDPANDTDPHAQDAAKVVIPAISTWMTDKLSEGIDASQTSFVICNAAGLVAYGASTSYNVKGRQIKIDDEIMIARLDAFPLDRPTGTYTVSQRGAYGTTAASHNANAIVQMGVNSLANQLTPPLGTSDGNTYFFTWDGYWTDSYLGTGLGNHKTFQFESNSLWLEPNTRFDGTYSAPPEWNPAIHVASVHARSYNFVGGAADWTATNGAYCGPNVTATEPLRPFASAARFGILPNRWIRWWVKIVQQANDYDLFSLWVADKDSLVQIYDGLQISVEPTSSPPHSIPKFWYEFNTSTDTLPAGRKSDFRDLVCYVRNFAALVNPPSDVSSLLIQPE